MTMRDSLAKWVESKSPGASEWLKPCEKFSDDDNVRALCIRFAEDYEAGKIPVEEFMGSIANMTGKDLDQIEQILNEISAEPKTVDGIIIGEPVEVKEPKRAKPVG